MDTNNNRNNNQKNNNNSNVYENIGQNIKDSLSEGLLTGDFHKLNMAISESVRDVVKEASIAAGEGIKNARAGYTSYTDRQSSEAYARMLQEKRKAHMEQMERERIAKVEEATRRRAQRQTGSRQIVKSLSNAYYRPIGRGSSIALTIFGAFGLVIGGSNILAALIGIIAAGAGVGSLIGWSIFVAACCGVLFKGIGQRKLLDRAYKYAQMAGNNMYAQISSIAASLGVSVKEVQKDIKKMLRKGYFPQGYLDDEGKTLMLSDEVFTQYQQAKSKQAEEARKKAEEALAQNEELKALSPEDRQKLGSMISTGNEYIARLHELNDNIPGEEITSKLNELESILKEIFRRVKEDPEQMDRMTKLMDYYLPTMIKLVEAYAEYDKVSTPGKDILDAKAEIEQTLDTINDAFVQLLNNLFQDSVWDVTTDAQVLKTMLKQEGLT